MSTNFSDEELQKALDQDLGEFEWERSRVGGTWEPEPNFPDFERKVVTSVPPVTIYVGRIPTTLNRSGLDNIFSKFGDILKMDLIRGKVAGAFNFAFITFCSRYTAAEAVAMVNRAPPLHLVVSFKISDKQKAERLEQEKMAEEFNIKWNSNVCPDGEELDYDEEVAREKRMEEEVDNFFDDSNSDVELSMLHTKNSLTTIEVEKEKVVAKCRRCGKKAQARCSTCKDAKYCGSACQGLDWPAHRRVCGERDDNSGKIGVVNTVEVVNEVEKKECSEYWAVVRSDEKWKNKIDEVLVSYGAGDNNCPANMTEYTSDQEEFVSLMDCVVDATKAATELQSGDVATATPSNSQDVSHLPPSKIAETKPDDPIYPDTSSLPKSIVKMMQDKDVTLEKDLPKCVLPDGCLVWLKDISEDGKWGVLKTVQGMGEMGERDMLEDVMQVCRELGSLVITPVVGQLVGVLHGERWVRAVVEKVEGGGGCVWLHGVDHLSYLKIEQLSQLAQLPEVSLIVPAQCRTVRLVISKLDRNAVDKMFKVKHRGEKNGFTRVELLAKGNEVSEDKKNEVVMNEEAESKIIDMPQRKIAEKQQAFETEIVTLTVGQMMNLTVLHVESPTVLYMCPVLPELKEFQKKLYRTASGLKVDPDFVPTVGSIVLARTMTDNYWYRVRVISCSEGRVTFFCPDFGFSDEVLLDSVRRIDSRLTDTFLSKKFLACRCVLKDWREGTSPPTEVETAAIKKIVRVSVKTVKVRVVEKVEDVYVVDIPGVNRDMLNRGEGMEEELVRLRRELEILKANI